MLKVILQWNPSKKSHLRPELKLRENKKKLNKMK